MKFRDCGLVIFMVIFGIGAAMNYIDYRIDTKPKNKTEKKIMREEPSSGILR